MAIGDRVAHSEPLVDLGLHVRRTDGDWPLSATARRTPGPCGLGSNPTPWRSRRVFSPFGVENAPTSDWTRPSITLYAGRNGSPACGSDIAAQPSVMSWTAACHVATVMTTTARLIEVSRTRRPRTPPPAWRCTETRLSAWTIARRKLAAA